MNRLPWQFWLKTKSCCILVVVCWSAHSRMVKTSAASKPKNKTLVTHQRSDLKSLQRESRRLEVEFERTNRRCNCPAWLPHSNNCPINSSLPVDSPHLSTLETIQRRVDKRSETKVEKIEVKIEPAELTTSGIMLEASELAKPAQVFFNRLRAFPLQWPICR